LTLQAADFLAWWVRNGYNDDILDEISRADFGTWKDAKPVPGFFISFTKDQLVDALILTIQQQGVPFNRTVYDKRYPETLLTRIRRFFQRL
jgi:hypothetical protein